jgi:hypothetical protein
MKLNLALLLLALAALLQGAPSSQEFSAPESTWVDTTIVTEQGDVIRYRGPLSGITGKPSAEEMAERDDRVPVGYGWNSLRAWAEGDPRPEPTFEQGVVITEFVHLNYSPSLRPGVGKAFAEYWDYIYYAIHERLGWTLDAPVPVRVPLAAKDYGREYGLPWWIPADVQDGVIVSQPISMITSRGIAMESLTHAYVEWQLRRKTEDRMPYWFLYGAGAYLGAEGWILQNQAEILAGEYDIHVDQATMIRDLEIFRDRELMMKAVESPGVLEDERCRSRLAFWRAFSLVQNIMVKEGLNDFKALVDAMSAAPELSFENAVRQVYDMSVDELVAKHEPW